MRGQAKIALMVSLVLLLGILVIGGVALAWGFSTYNRLVSLHEQIPAAWSQVENVLQRRNDLIPNLVATVKGYAKHEDKIYGDISHALEGVRGARSLPDKVSANNQLEGLLTKLLSISITYPNIKADAQFIRLQDELAGTENRIAVERMRFNQMVQEYNTTVKTFPSSFIAHLAHLSPSETYFKAAESAQTVPQVTF